MFLINICLFHFIIEEYLLLSDLNFKQIYIRLIESIMTIVTISITDVTQTKKAENNEVFGF